MQCGVKGSAHLGSKDFSAVIARALELPGFTQADCSAAEAGFRAAAASGISSGKQSVMVGFGHEAVLSVAPEVIQAIHDARLKHIFVIGENTADAGG